MRSEFDSWIDTIIYLLINFYNKKNMEKFRLISMTDFVLEKLDKTSPNNFIKAIESIRFFAEFLKQPLKLGMFVPCDDDGNVLEEPQKANFTEKDGFVNNAFFIKINDFQKAQAKVIFNNCVVQKQGGEYLVLHTQIPIWVDWNNSKTIEDLIPYNLDLAVSF